MKRHVVRPHQPGRIALLTAVLMALLIASGWFLAEFSHWELIRSQMARNQETRTLWQNYRDLQSENERLRQRLSTLETGTNIDRGVAEELQQEVVQLQDEIFRLTREVEFYQGIVSSAQDVDGLAIQALLMQATRQPNQRRFKLVLTHGVKNDKVIEGVVEISLEGRRNGSEQILTFRDIARDESLSLDYRFRHFKRFEGLVQLPDGFEPQRVRVELIPRDDSHERIDRVFEWSDVTG